MRDEDKQRVMGWGIIAAIIIVLKSLFFSGSSNATKSIPQRMREASEARARGDYDGYQKAISGQ